MKKNKFLVGIVAALAVSAIGLTTVGCNNVVEDIKKGWEQLTCEHVFDDGEVLKESTCVEMGEIQKTCTLCGKVEIQELELAEHIAVYVQAVTPTCIEKGVTDGTVCSVCETKISGFQEIPALGHIIVKDSAVEPTCLEEGLTEGEHCSRCNEVLKAQEKVSATGHNLVILESVEATCTTEGKTQGVWCDTCKTIFTAQEVIPVQAHSFVEGICVCGAVKTSHMTEVQANVGDSYAGKIFRIYEGGSLSDNRGPYLFVGSGLSSSWAYELEGVKIVTYEGYIEVFFEEGATITCFPSSDPDNPLIRQFDESVIHESSVLEGVYILTTETVSD